MGEYSPGHSRFVVPTDNVRVAETLDEDVEKPGRNRRIESADQLRLLKIDEQQEKRPVGKRRSLAFVREEVTKRLLVIGPVRIQISCEIAGGVIRVLRYPQDWVGWQKRLTPETQSHATNPLFLHVVRAERALSTDSKPTRLQPGTPWNLVVAIWPSPVVQRNRHGLVRRRP